MCAKDTVTLYWPVGPTELELIRQSGFLAFPPRLPEQPIFYPVLTEAYAAKIARDWSVSASGAGFVTRLAVLTSFLDAYPVRDASGSAHLEYWIPAEALPGFNAAIVGLIEVVAEYHRSEDRRWISSLKCGSARTCSIQPHGPSPGSRRSSCF